MRKIPATMSTQHPDNANLPSWVEEENIQGEDEVHEAYYVYSRLGCEEQMWDWEGKDVDPNIVRKLLTQYSDFFRENVLGQDVFLTYRVPNPAIEEAEKKSLGEALESIPRSYDVAKTFARAEINPPIFEVILPMTTSSQELIRVLSYYKKIVVGKENTRLNDEDVEVRDWIGEFQPKTIEMIPLVEDDESLSRIDRVLEGYIRWFQPPYLRVFLARSDPALNYGLFPAVLLNKLALSMIRRLSREKGIDIYPIVGTGSLPFRGHAMPDNLDRFMDEYAGVLTVTVQSALKYDFPEEVVRSVVDRMNGGLRRRKILELSNEQEAILRGIIQKLKEEYQKRVEALSRFVNHIAAQIPQRRARKLHIGLFGYGRDVGKVKLPRAIGFTAALYSIGIPPEVLGASAISDLSEEEWDLLDQVYVNWRGDLEFAAGYICWQNINYLMGEKEIVEQITDRYGLKYVLPEIAKDLEVIESNLKVRLGPRNLDNRRHENLVNNILISVAQGTEGIKEYIEEAARIRHSLG